MDSMEETQEFLAQRRVNRRNMLRALGGGAALATLGMGMAGCGGDDDDDFNPNPNPNPDPNTISDTDILNFALNLEYLEAEFYSYAVRGTGIDPMFTTGTGTHGPTTGGRQVALSAPLSQVAAQLAADELAHVRFLRAALGAAAVAKPAINLNALGIGYGNEIEFLTVARAFEDVGVSAYTGAANLIADKNLLQAAAQIQAIEAYHAGNLRYQAAVRGINGPQLDAKDQPPSTSNFFPTDSNGLAIARTPAEVGAIVRGSSPSGGAFFPNGLNGTIR